MNANPFVFFPISISEKRGECHGKIKPRSKSEQAKAISSAEAAENARRERREDKIMADCDEDDDEEDLFAAPSDDDE